MIVLSRWATMQRCSSGQQLFQGILHHQLGGGVDGTGGFVQHENPQVGKEGAGQQIDCRWPSDMLAIAFADVGLIAVLEGQDHVVRAD